MSGSQAGCDLVTSAQGAAKWRIEALEKPPFGAIFQHFS